MTGFRPDTDRNKIDELERKLGDILDLQIFADSGNDQSSVFGGLGARNAAHGDASGNRSSTPSTHTLTKTNTPPGEISLRTQNIIVDHATDTILNLYWFDDAQKDGQIIKIKPKDTKTLVLKVGGNIDISSDITIIDSEYAELVFWEDAGTGKWLLIKSGSGGGGGSASFPLQYPISNHGSIGLVTEIFDLNFHAHKATLTGDISVAFSNPPIVSLGEDFKIHFFHDGLAGDRIVTFPVSVKNLTTVTLSVGEDAIIVLTTDDGGVTYDVNTQGGVASGGSDASLWSIFPSLQNVDMANFGFSSVASIEGDENPAHLIVSSKTADALYPHNGWSQNVPTGHDHRWYVNDLEVLKMTDTKLVGTGKTLEEWAGIIFSIGNTIVDNPSSLDFSRINAGDAMQWIFGGVAQMALTTGALDMHQNNIINMGGGTISLETTENIIDATNDKLLFYDASANALRKTSISNISAASVSSFSDGLFNIFDDIDNSRVAKFQTGGISAATTRTVNFQNATGTMALLEPAQSWSGINTFNGGVIINSVLDMGTFQIQSMADPTTAQSAATKAYVDANAVGQNWSDPIDAVITTDGTPRQVGTAANRLGNTFLTNLDVNILTVSGLALLNGDVSIGNTISDIVNINGIVSTDVRFSFGNTIDFNASQNSVGSTGFANLLPSKPTGYLIVKQGGVEVVVPYYDKV